MKLGSQHCVVVTADIYNWNLDDRVRDALKLKGVKFDGSGAGFGGRDLFFYASANTIKADLLKAVRRIRRWKHVVDVTVDSVD